MHENVDGSLDIVSQPEFADLSQLKRDILYVISGLDDPKGLEIKDELSTYYDEEINHGRLYPNLDDLAEAGFVDKFKVNGRSNGYRLTTGGRNLMESRRRWEQTKLARLSVDTSDSEESTVKPRQTSPGDDSEESTVKPRQTSPGDDSEESMADDDASDIIAENNILDELTDEFEDI
ncbi:hypothetical protein HARCEL1_12895 [Halococcoides cellulosivorans]|uniref:Transcription regulator PadR N-terminal domain-containing protein n=2 Tax=Halococcoides cellulosivorans TaxID=1679096 RepID=A0A2R4X4L6_9EURY|nr:hypothetical protein HARCEL1_12895 [Halococcoides cellulosivorans]